ERVRRLEKKNKLKDSGLRRLKKVGTAQKFESSADTEVDAEKDAEVAADLAKDAAVQGRQKESQAQVYHIDLKHADKVLGMHDDEPEPAELKEPADDVANVAADDDVVVKDAAEPTPPSPTPTITPPQFE
nr:hypothetical protein [Tanacetum cinerariifolium]